MNIRSLVFLPLGLAAFLVLAGGGRADSLTTPGQIGGLGLWLSAQDLAAGLAGGQPVLRWPDRSPSGYDAIYEPRVPQTELRAGFHRPPSFKADALAGRPAVAFNAVDRESLLLNRAAHALGQRIHGFSAIFLIRPTLSYGAAPASGIEWSANRYVFITHLSDYSTRFSVQVMTPTGEVRVVSRTQPKLKLDLSSSFTAERRLALTGNAWHRLGVTVDYQAKVVRIFIDGEIVAHPLPADSPDLFEDVPSPIAGIGSDTLGNWLTCQMADIICYQRALSIDELGTVDRYLCATYGLGNQARGR